MAQEVQKSLNFTHTFASGDSAPNLSEEQLLTKWLVFDGIPKFGAQTLVSLTQSIQCSPLSLLTFSHSQLKSIGFSPDQITAILSPDHQKIERQLMWCAASNDHFAIYPGHPKYPKLLSEIARPPFILFGIGNQALLNAPQLAIVGSRRPSHYGRQQAAEFAQQIATSGFCITSGLAAGIDACAHQGALNVGGSTIAVLGNGLKHIYPKRHQQLARSIVDNDGLILSEFHVDAAPKAHHFPRRNRLVSGLCCGVLVVEAAIKSGSLITAKYALEQNREVMAIPGSLLNPLSEGGHHLIKQGAKLVTDINDILEEFQNVSSCNTSTVCKKIQKSPSESLATDKLLDSVGYDVTALDVIIQRSKLPINDVLVQLLEYELRGSVASVPGGYVKLRGK